MIKEKLKKLLNIKVIYFVICLFVITLFICLKNTHAFYNYESAWVPIFNSKVGNFAGKGDTSPLDKPTDINVMYYFQNGVNLKQYDVYDTPPANIQSNYVLDEKRSNCIPTDATFTKYSNRDFSITSDGTVTIKVSEKTPKQIVCRIYYSFNLVDYKEPDSDVKIVYYIQSDTGDIVTIRDNKKYIVGDTIPTGYTMTYYECDNQDNIKTEIIFDTNGIKFTTNGKNTCHAYFDKA